MNRPSSRNDDEDIDYSILRRRDKEIGLFIVSLLGRADFRPNPSLLVLEVESSTSADSRLGFG